MPAGDRYVEVTLDDMDAFLRRAFRALKPKKGESRGEVYYDLNLSDDEVIVRVWTSIRPRSEAGAGLGEDAIRVTMITKNGKPLMPKGKIVMRTKNWRDALQDRIEDLHEVYESQADYWKSRRRERDEGTTREVVPKPPAKSGDLIEGKWRQLPNGDWGALIAPGAQAGDVVMMKTNGGAKSKVTLVDKVKSAPYGDLWKVDKGAGRTAGVVETSIEPPLEDILASRVAARYLNRSV